MIDRRSRLTGAAALAVTAAGRPALAIPAVKPPPPSAPIPGLTLAPELYPSVVTVRRDLEPGTIHVISSKYFLYYIARKGVAIRYGVAVGKAELVFRGAAEVGKKVEWPSGKPTPEMIARNPGAYAKYADGMPGGPKNPLGARAIYLFQDGRDTAIRIHGTIEPNSIGKSVSNGCLRMVNAHVIDLYDRVALGAPVMVY